MHIDTHTYKNTGCAHCVFHYEKCLYITPKILTVPFGPENWECLFYNIVTWKDITAVNSMMWWFIGKYATSKWLKKINGIWILLRAHKDKPWNSILAFTSVAN